MPSNWPRLIMAVGLGFLISTQAFAQSGLPGFDNADASAYRKSRLKKSKLPGMSDTRVPKNKLGQPKVWNSRDKKFEVKGGVVQRFWLEKDHRLNLGILDTDYQLGISFLSGPREFEFAFAGGKSGGQNQHSKNEIDRNNLILFGPWILIDDVPVKLNYTEDIKLWNFQLHYWHNLGNPKPESFQVGPGVHFYVLEKHTKMQVQYEDWGPGFLILNPHYQNSESHSTTLIPGISLGARGRLSVGSRNQNYGSILIAGECIFAKPASNFTIGGQPVNKFNSFNFSLQYAYAFE